MSTQPTSVAEFVAQGRTIVAAGVLTVGTSEQELPQHEGNTLVIVRPLAANPGVISAGLTGVTAGNGFELAGTEYFPLTDSSALKFIGTDVADKVGYLILK